MSKNPWVHPFDVLSVELFAMAAAKAAERSSGLDGRSTVSGSDAALCDAIPRLGPLGFAEFRPNPRPFVGKHVFPRDNAAGKAFNVRGALCSDGSVAAGHLR